jgi:Na+-transporting methylmalonyl-CoA/oxaloacetate decarboxylase gamma subunit
MSLSESILIALFCISVVFAVLGLLWAIIRVFSSFIKAIEKRNEKSTYGSNP